MREIYSQSACTIAAAYGGTSEAGIFHPNPEVFQPRILEISKMPGSEESNAAWPLPGTYWCESWTPYADYIEDSPLGSRAWICQERQLAPRILYFTERGIFWECHEQRTCQNYAQSLPDWALPGTVDDSLKMKRTLHSAKTQTSAAQREKCFAHYSVASEVSHPDVYYDWCQFRRAYSNCNLSVPSDKLIAIQGIAELAGASMKDQLVAGLWLNCILRDLCWFFLFGLEGEVLWRAPSWSWAKKDNLTWISSLYELHRECSTRSTRSEVEDISVETKADGQIESGTLHLRCKPVSAIIRPSPMKVHLDDPSGSMLLGRKKTEVQITKTFGATHSKFNIWLDVTESYEERSAVLVALQQCLLDHTEDDSCDNPNGQKTGHQRSDHPMIEGLVLVRVSEHDDLYERIGLFNVSSAEKIGKFFEEEESIESTVITII